MQYPTLTRQTWTEAVKASGIRLEVIAVETGKSYSAVYRYLTGTRNPTDEWIAQVDAVLASRRAAA